MVNHPNRSKPLRESNAELLAALKEATKSLEYAARVLQPPEDSAFMDCLRDVRAAIAKVEGRS